MAFELANWDADGVSPNSNAPGKWKYASSSDALATIAASAYFNDVDHLLSIGDLVYVVASDDAQFLKVTAVTPNVTTTQFSEVVDDGSITTAKLADGAVTAGAKMALSRGTLYVGDATNQAAEVGNAAAGALLVGNGADVGSVLMSGDATMDGAGAVTLAAGSVSLANLDTGITPSHVMFGVSPQTTVGGAATEAFTVAGALVTDTAWAVVKTQGAVPVTVNRVDVTGADTVTITFSADPSNDHVINIFVLRPAS